MPSASYTRLSPPSFSSFSCANRGFAAGNTSQNDFRAGKDDVIAKRRLAVMNAILATPTDPRHFATVLTLRAFGKVADVKPTITYSDAAADASSLTAATFADAYLRGCGKYIGKFPTGVDHVQKVLFAVSNVVQTLYSSRANADTYLPYSGQTADNYLVLVEAVSYMVRGVLLGMPFKQTAEIDLAVVKREFSNGYVAMPAAVKQYTFVGDELLPSFKHCADFENGTTHLVADVAPPDADDFITLTTALTRRYDLYANVVNYLAYFNGGDFVSTNSAVMEYAFGQFASIAIAVVTTGVVLHDATYSITPVEVDKTIVVTPPSGGSQSVNYVETADVVSYNSIICYLFAVVMYFCFRRRSSSDFFGLFVNGTCVIGDTFLDPGRAGLVDRYIAAFCSLFRRIPYLTRTCVPAPDVAPVATSGVESAVDETAAASTSAEHTTAPTESVEDSPSAAVVTDSASSTSNVVINVSGGSSVNLGSLVGLQQQKLAVNITNDADVVNTLTTETSSTDIAHSQPVAVDDTVRGESYAKKLFGSIQSYFAPVREKRDVDSSACARVSIDVSVQTCEALALPAPPSVCSDSCVQNAAELVTLKIEFDALKGSHDKAIAVGNLLRDTLARADERVRELEADKKHLIGEAGALRESAETLESNLESSGNIVQTLTSELDVLKREKSSAEDLLRDSRNSAEELNARLDSLMIERDALRSQLDEYKSQAVKAVVNSTTCEDCPRVLASTTAAIETVLAKHNAYTAAAGEKIVSLQQDLESVNKMLALRTREFSDVSAVNEKLRDDLHVATLEIDTIKATHKRSMESHLRERDALMSKSEQLEKVVSDLTDSCASLNTSNSILTERLDELDAELAAAATDLKRFDECEVALTAANANIEKLERENAALKLTHDASTKQLADFTAEIDHLNTRCSLLSDDCVAKDDAISSLRSEVAQLKSQCDEIALCKDDTASSDSVLIEELSQLRAQNDHLNALYSQCYNSNTALVQQVETLTGQLSIFEAAPSDSDDIPTRLGFLLKLMAEVAVDARFVANLYKFQSAQYMHAPTNNGDGRVECPNPNESYGDSERAATSGTHADGAYAPSDTQSANDHGVAAGESVGPHDSEPAAQHECAVRDSSSKPPAVGSGSSDEGDVRHAHESDDVDKRRPSASPNAVGECKSAGEDGSSDKETARGVIDGIVHDSSKLGDQHDSVRGSLLPTNEDGSDVPTPPGACELHDQSAATIHPAPATCESDVGKQQPVDDSNAASAIADSSHNLPADLATKEVAEKQLETVSVDTKVPLEVEELPSNALAIPGLEEVDVSKLPYVVQEPRICGGEIVAVDVTVYPAPDLPCAITDVDEEVPNFDADLDDDIDDKIAMEIEARERERAKAAIDNQLDAITNLISGVGEFSFTVPSEVLPDDRAPADVTTSTIAAQDFRLAEPSGVSCITPTREVSETKDDVDDEGFTVVKNRRRQKVTFKKELESGAAVDPDYDVRTVEPTVYLDESGGTRVQAVRASIINDVLSLDQSYAVYRAYLKYGRPKSTECTAAGTQLLVFGNASGAKYAFTIVEPRVNGVTRFWPKSFNRLSMHGGQLVAYSGNKGSYLTASQMTVKRTEPLREIVPEDSSIKVLSSLTIVGAKTVVRDNTIVVVLDEVEEFDSPAVLMRVSRLISKANNAVMPAFEDIDGVAGVMSPSSRNFGRVLPLFDGLKLVPVTGTVPTWLFGSVTKIDRAERAYFSYIFGNSLRSIAVAYYNAYQYFEVVDGERSYTLAGVNPMLASSHLSFGEFASYYLSNPAVRARANAVSSQVGSVLSRYTTLSQLLNSNLTRLVTVVPRELGIILGSMVRVPLSFELLKHTASRRFYAPIKTVLDIANYSTYAGSISQSCVCAACVNGSEAEPHIGIYKVRDANPADLSATLPDMYSHDKDRATEYVVFNEGAPLKEALPLPGEAVYVSLSEGEYCVYDFNNTYSTAAGAERNVNEQLTDLINQSAVQPCKVSASVNNGLNASVVASLLANRRSVDTFGCVKKVDKFSAANISSLSSSATALIEKIVGASTVFFDSVRPTDAAFSYTAAETGTEEYDLNNFEHFVCDYSRIHVFLSIAATSKITGIVYSKTVFEIPLEHYVCYRIGLTDGYLYVYHYMPSSPAAGMAFESYSLRILASNGFEAYINQSGLPKHLSVEGLKFYAANGYIQSPHLLGSNWRVVAECYDDAFSEPEKVLSTLELNFPILSDVIPFYNRPLSRIFEAFLYVDYCGIRFYERTNQQIDESVMAAQKPKYQVTISINKGSLSVTGSGLTKLAAALAKKGPVRNTVSFVDYNYKFNQLTSSTFEHQFEVGHFGVALKVDYADLKEYKYQLLDSTEERAFPQNRAVGIYESFLNSASVNGDYANIIYDSTPAGVEVAEDVGDLFRRYVFRVRKGPKTYIVLGQSSFSLRGVLSKLGYAGTALRRGYYLEGNATAGVRMYGDPKNPKSKALFTTIAFDAPADGYGIISQAHGFLYCKDGERIFHQKFTLGVPAPRPVAKPADKQPAGNGDNNTPSRKHRTTPRHRGHNSKTNKHADNANRMARASDNGGGASTSTNSAN